jgi:LPXTG-site transpeptidase (sortase) family protein
MAKPAKLARKKKTSQKKKVQSHVLRNKIIGLLFLCLALFILLLPQLLPKKIIDNKNPIKINSSLYTSTDVVNNPVRILIPKSNIDLKVIDAKIVNGYWEISEDTASYGLGSGHPGIKSNTVIFAHAREGLFYNLKDVQVDDIIYVFTKTKWYRYKVSKIAAVYPNQTEVIKPTKNEVLTLYTCTGFSDEKRLIVTALPQN